ncbi:hypothetical protein BD324DRAFT_683723 [Kockovaella imperatae]|uniref:Macrofage activating glycoprotein n=1 Tax=Kockovaella imperatae TaxID=4999 RepID=A0A1Y1UB47_9TREE|nr:hypothetical protein BD324DRAFT_683723 [Kockovaella imperatae]ORX34305.1 hypothetical protein BD324DRAFT_683723 [Kockovaella imperatae]
MRSMAKLPLALTLLALPLASAQYTATYTVGDLPNTSQQGQSGTNNCGTTDSQTSECQNVFLNSVNDFCLWGPPSNHSDEGNGSADIGNVEQVVVSYCLKDGYGTRLIPDGTISSAHFVKVVSENVSYVQVSGTGDMTKILIPEGDWGGELDPHSWTGLGNPQGGLVFTNAFTGQYEQTHEWTSFMSYVDFCFRACQDGPNAPGYCEHIYDTLGCSFTIPGSEGPGFDDCLGDPGAQPGVYGGTTFTQGAPSTPAAHPDIATSQCTTYSSVGGGSVDLASGSPTSSSSTTSASAASTTSSTSSASMSMSTSSAASSRSSGSSAMATATTSRASTNSGSSNASGSSSSASASASHSGAADRNMVTGGSALVAGVAAVMAMIL